MRETEGRRYVPASFRDPSGAVFEQAGNIFREVRFPYKPHYDKLVSSGLYEELVRAGLLIPHEEISLGKSVSGDVYRILRPERIPFISYPYEWSFSQLIAAAEATLAVQRRALQKGMILKDASAYNIQFKHGRPMLIDTLSFQTYKEGQPWAAYRQFCQQFVAPLALVCYKDVRLSQLLRVYVDGIPLDLASRLLPLRTLVKLSVLFHIHLHAWSQRRYSSKTIRKGGRRMSFGAMLGLLRSLESAVCSFRWQPRGTQWADYSSDESYTPEAFAHKQEVVRAFLREVRPQSVWDLGSNIGTFGRLSARMGIPTVTFDLDPAAVEKNYLQCVDQGETNLLPLLMDLTNPSPKLGWDYGERMNVHERGPADMVLALALIHHLAISNNVPLGRLATFFASLAQWLVVEFVPKEDPKVQALLASREDVFPDYSQEAFEKAFSKCFFIRCVTPIEHSPRTLYLMERCLT